GLVVRLELGGDRLRRRVGRAGELDELGAQEAVDDRAPETEELLLRHAHGVGGHARRDPRATSLAARPIPVRYHAPAALQPRGTARRRTISTPAGICVVPGAGG